MHNLRRSWPAKASRSHGARSPSTARRSALRRRARGGRPPSGPRPDDCGLRRFRSREPAATAAIESSKHPENFPGRQTADKEDGTMQVNLSGHHVEITPALRGYVEKKLARILRHH